MAPDLSADIQRGLEALGLDVGLVGSLRKYLDLLAKWNRAYNLSAVRDSREMVGRHLLDSLTILPYVAGPRVLDMGSGAGLPGIPLAIARPDWRLVLLDGNGKKTRFMRQAALELPLPNVEVVHARAEALAPEVPFDSVVSRAFADLGDFVALAAPLVRETGGRILAMKGRLSNNELNAVAGTEYHRTVHELRVPGLSAERHLIELSR